jgi:hypothetical protein
MLGNALIVLKEYQKEVAPLCTHFKKYLLQIAKNLLFLAIANQVQPTRQPQAIHKEQNQYV